MSSGKSVINSLMLAIAVLAITACVPKATEKKAICGVNEEFSSVSRSCYNIEEKRTRPVGTTTNVSANQETPKTVILTYSDANKDQALTCKIITVASTGVETVSPSITNSEFDSKAEEVNTVISSIILKLPFLAADDVLMKSFLQKAKNSIYLSAKEASFTNFISKANTIINASGSNLIPTDQYLYVLGQQKLSELNKKFIDVKNRCECSSGICSTTLVPLLNKTGVASFSYTVTDRDGESDVRPVSVVISSDLNLSSVMLPVAQSGAYTGLESATSTADSYSITIPGSGDLLGTSVNSYLYKFKTMAGFTRKQGIIPGVVPAVFGYYGETPEGVVYNCMDLYPYVSLSNDKTCTYIPFDGDDSDHLLIDAGSPHPNASAAMNDSTVFTAIATGSAGNSLKVQYLDIKSAYPNSQVYGLTDSSEAFIRIIGNDIKIFINSGVTTSAQIQTLVNGHPQANKLVTTSGGGILPVASAVVALTGGLDAFDKIPFEVNNTQSSSVNTAAVTIRMTAINDAPMVPKTYLGMPFLQTETFTEDTARLDPVTLKFKDVDHSLGFTVEIMIDPALPTCATGNEAAIKSYFESIASSSTDFLIGVPGAISADLAPNSYTFNVSVTPQSDFAGTKCLYYRITDLDSAKSFVQTVNIIVDPINDEPFITVTSINNSPILPVLFPIDPLYPLDPLNPLHQLTILEGGEGYMDIEIYPGGSGYESSQVVVLTIDNDKPTLFPTGKITIGELPIPVAGKKRITFKPADNQSGIALITFNTLDNGGVVNVGDDDSGTTSFSLTVKAVNNPPVFLPSIIDPVTSELTQITKIETNEGGAVQSHGFLIDEDQGNTGDEDNQSITIDSIVSDNPSVLPNSAIKIFYDLNDNEVEDVGEARIVGDVIEFDASQGVEKHKLYLKLDPVDGIAGNANIKMTISDHVLPGDPLAIDPAYAASSNSVVKEFSLIVHPIAALHGGWNNISSVGIKIDKNKAPAKASDIQCEYNKVADVKNCGSSDCTGSVSPNSTIVPNAINVVYWDSSSLRCYRSTGTNEYSWVDMNTTCPIKKSGSVCPGNNCFNSGDPTGSIDPDKVGQYLLDVTNNLCYISSGEANTDWIEYTPAKVTLAWKSFIMTGSGPDINVDIAGWNVYRRDIGKDYNFKKGGHLKDLASTNDFSIVGSNIKTFTDTTAIAGRIYYYTVRPVDSIRLFPTYTPESFSEVRVIAAPANYSFVHRWIVNQEICNGMNITTTTTPYHVDQTKNFRCEYSGPGSVDDNGISYYDYKNDLLVDTVETGCAYATGPSKCTANGCIGIGNPGTNNYSAAVDDLYYDRSSGVCYINTGGATWDLFQNAALVTAAVTKNTNTSLNAPLTNLSRADARNVCESRTPPDITYTYGATIEKIALTSATMKLPNKKDYMGYASQKLDKTNYEISTIEEGYSLNVESGCNSRSASGLDSYTDSGIPSTSYIYSLPGTLSSGIRSIYTGSIPWAINKGTEACVSRFGIQDLYGNVAEWVDDEISCDPGANVSKVCSVTVGSPGSFTATDFGLRYKFDNLVGPYNELGDGIVTYAPVSTSLTTPGGITAGDLALDVTSSAAFPATGVVLIGSEFIYYGAKTPTTLTNLVRGYNSTTAAIHNSGDSVSYSAIDDTHLTNWTFKDQFFGANYFNYPLGLPLSGNINQPSFSAYFDWILPIGPSSGITDDQLHDDGIIVNGSPGAVKSFAVGGSYLSGKRSGRYSFELIDNSVANRPDVGFRCVVPIEPTDYKDLINNPF